MCLLLLVWPLVGAHGAVSMATDPYTQDFNSLAKTGSSIGWTNDSTLPGWTVVLKSFDPVNLTTYMTNAGSSASSGILYSYGTVGSSDRALGAVASTGPLNSKRFSYQLTLVNDTGYTENNIRVSYTGEQWRKSGTTNRHTLSFSYAFAGGKPNTTAVPELDFVSPVNTSGAGALNGNASADRQTFSNIEIPGLQVQPGQTLLLQWAESEDSGAGHALAIDDVTINWEEDYFMILPPPDITVTSFADVPPPDVNSVDILYPCGNVTVTWANDSYLTNGCTTTIYRTYGAVDDCARTNSATQTITVSQPPINDRCGNAIPMTLGVVYSMNTDCATSTGDPVPECTGVPAKGVWYTFVPQFDGVVSLNTCGSGFLTSVSVYTGDCDSLTPVSGACDGGFSSIDSCPTGLSLVEFPATQNTKYWILAGGNSGATGDLQIHATECHLPKIQSIYLSSESAESNGIHLTFCASATGDGLTYFWSVSNNVPVLTYSDPTASCFTVVVSPTNEIPVGVKLNVNGACNPGDQGGGSGSACAFCLSHGTPSLLTGATGSGISLSASGTCGALSANTRWYRMLAYDTGPITVSVEGSSNVNQIAVCAGPSLASLTNITCVLKPQTRLTFNAVANAVYWFAVDPGTNSPSTLRVASGYEPSIQSIGVKNGVFELLSTIAPPTTYKVLASTDPALPFSNWPVVFSTNWNTNYPVTDFRVDFLETNLINPRQKFYRLAPGP